MSEVGFGSWLTLGSSLDVSGSTDLDFMISNSIAYVDADGDGVGSFAAPDPGDDFNGDGEAGETLDGEISGVLSLNLSIGNPSNVTVGAQAFASSAEGADVLPTAPNTFPIGSTLSSRHSICMRRRVRFCLLKAPTIVAA